MTKQEVREWVAQQKSGMGAARSGGDVKKVPISFAMWPGTR